MEVNESNYKEQTDKLNGYVLFWAPWDKNSTTLKDELYPSKLEIEFNIDEAANIPAMLGIKFIPSIGMYKNGQLVGILSGDEFKETI